MFLKVLGCITLSLGLLGACKKEEAKPHEPTTEARPATVPAAPGAPGALITSAADYETKGMAILDKMIAMFKEAGANCDKLAADVTVFVDQNKPMILAADEYGNAHPEVKKAFEAKVGPRIEEMGAAMQPAIAACENHKGLEAAMARMPK
jgi:hypothetical protein